MLSGQRWLCVLIFLLSLSSCDKSRGLSAFWRVGVYQGTWEYRYGESPGASLRPDIPEWAVPDHQDGGWHPTLGLGMPAGRKGSRTLWLRTRLIGPPLGQ